MRFDGDLRLRSGLAERWSNPDDRTYRFVLRPGVRFSDGRLLTTGDVVASLEANRKRWVTRDFLQAIESVRAVGEHEVEIRTRLPYLALLTRLPWGLVLPAEELDTRAHGAPGTGPYTIESWPAFERVVHTVVPNASTRLALVERGLADAADPELDRLTDEADGARADAERAVRLRRAVARADALRAALPLVVQTETVVLSRRLAWVPPFNMALAPEDVRPTP